MERYLDECLASIQSQTLTNIEVICLNDGSTDNSSSIIKKYADSDRRFRAIEKANSGYGSSMNLGLRLAKGQFIGIVEADDFIEPDMFQNLCEAANENNSQIVYCNYFNYTAAPSSKNLFVEVFDKTICNKVVNPQVTKEVFLYSIGIWAGIYRRDYLQRNSISFLESPGASYQDTGFILKCLVSANCTYFLHRAYHHYRKDNEASSVHRIDKVFCVNDEYEEVLRYLRTYPDRERALRPVINRRRFSNYMWNYERIDQEFKLMFLSRMREEYLKEIAGGFIDWNYFGIKTKATLQLIIESPETFYLKNSRSTSLQKLLDLIRAVKRSGLKTSYQTVVRLAKLRIHRVS